MKFKMKLAGAFRSLKSLALLATTGLCLPTTIASAQFNNYGGALPDWYNQAMPSASGGSSSYSTTGISTTNSPGSIISNNVGWQNWQIGIYKQDLNVGTLVQDVQNNSAASRAGIKKDDLIVTVNGQQVGVTPRGTVDIGVLANQTAVNGRIVALVADGITGKLKNVTIDLAQTSVELKGLIRLPNVGLTSSYLTVTLKNVSRQQYQVVGGKTTGDVYGSGPFNFTLNIDPTSVVPTDKYQLETRIDDTRSTQYYSLVDVDINRVLSGNAGYLSINVEPYQQWLARNANNGQVVSVGYSGANLTSDVTTTFQSIIGRLPTSSELSGWSSFLLEGNSLNEMKIRLLSHQTFYDRVGNDPTQFVIQMIRILSNRQPTNDEISRWTTRLVQLQGYREAVVREYLNSTGSGGQLR
jgi:hypothetical protein